MEQESEYSYEKCLKKLEDSIPEYIKKVGKFQHENQEWELAEWKMLPRAAETCRVCGKRPIKELFIIRNLRTNELKIVGNECIRKIASPKIANWFAPWEMRRERLERNKPLMEHVDALIRAYKPSANLLNVKGVGEVPFHVSITALKKFRKMRERLCKGYNATKDQRGLWKCYCRRIIEAVEQHKKANTPALDSR